MNRLLQLLTAAAHLGQRVQQPGAGHRDGGHLSGLADMGWLSLLSLVGGMFGSLHARMVLRRRGALLREIGRDVRGERSRESAVSA